MTKGEIEQAVRDARGFVMSGGAGYVATEIARALICLSEAMAAPVGGELGAIGEQIETVADYHVKCALFGNNGPDARAFHGDAASILSNSVPRLLAAIRARDAEVARLNRLAKAERAYRVAWTARANGLVGADREVVDARATLIAAGGEP